MNYTDKVSRVLHCFIMIFAVALVAACNTTAPVRSSGAPGAPGSPGSSGPSVQVSVPGMPDVPGVPGAPGLPPAGSGDASGAPAPGTISVPAPQAGLPSGETGGVPATAQSGAQQKSGGSQPAAGTGQEKTDNEILAEALQELNKRRASLQQGEDATGQTPAAGADVPATTAAEKQQSLGKELEEGFAEFDQLMLSEQQANNERADQEGYGEFLEEDDFPAEGDPAQSPAGEPLQTAMVDSDPASIEGEMDIPTRSHSQVPPDLVDASGDDIIARQLREAAMKEQDPELREKLWDEYRKYKRDLR